jgi:hypothetical protein
MNSVAEQPRTSAPGNPFLEPLDALLSTENLEPRLQNSPLRGMGIAELSLQARHDLLDRLQEQMFEPTLSSIDTTSRLYRLIRRGYVSRNPAEVGTRSQSMSLARFAGKEISDLPWLSTSAKGMRVSGITGLGKTYEIKRALMQLPQKISHGLSRSAGWTHMTQATWLYVGMSHDGSLGGLLLQILTELDKAIGTSYARERGLTGLSNEKLAVHVGIILNNHGVGVLVIDELQARNFSGGARGGLAATFFLRLLNFGVPIVLMGNPKGMSVLDTFSQDMRRVGSGGSIEMHPMEEDEFDFANVLAPALWRYNVMPEPSPINDVDGSILFKYCGGIRDYAARIRVCSQRLALDQDDRFVTEEHMNQAFMGPDFSSKERALIAGFRDKNPLLLQSFDDVPWESYAAKWGLYPTLAGAQPSISPSTASNSAEKKEAKPRKPAAQVAGENAKRKRTQKAKAEAKNSAIRETLDPTDMRNEGLKAYLISSMNTLADNDLCATPERR